MARVELRDVRKRFGTTEIVRGVSLAVEPGELMVLVGPSGCGKSTVLRLVAGLEATDGGEIEIGGRVVNDVAPKDRDVAMVFQSYALYPHMTVRENLAFPLKLRGKRRAEIDAAVTEAARLLEIEPLLGRLPKELSGGQRQRVAMGRAIVRRPAVFLFDEPLSNLDAALRNQMRVEIKQLHRRLRTTAIYVTHDQVEAMTLADRLAVLERGALQQVGTAREVFDRPANRFVAGFIGSPSMNFLAARVERGRLVGEGLRLSLPAGLDAALEGRAVTAGVRPNDLRLTPHGAESAPGGGSGSAAGGAAPGVTGGGEAGPGIAAKVTLVEPLGWESHVHLRAGESALVAVAESASLHGIGEGTEVTCTVPEGRLHLFDATTGEALR
jgi:multiple sugar transport system ATP-binding protein